MPRSSARTKMMLGLGGCAASRPWPGRMRRKGTGRRMQLRLSFWCSWSLFEAEYFDFTNAHPAAFVKTRHRDLHVTDLPGFLELQVVDLRRGGGVGLIAQEGPVLPVGRAFDFVPIPFSRRRASGSGNRKDRKAFPDRPATTPARPRVRHRRANRSPDRRRWPGPRYVHRSQSTNCTPACSRQGCPGRRRRSKQPRRTGRKEPGLRNMPPVRSRGDSSWHRPCLISFAGERGCRVCGK